MATLKGTWRFNETVNAPEFEPNSNGYYVFTQKPDFVTVNLTDGTTVRLESFNFYVANYSFRIMVRIDNRSTQEDIYDGRTGWEEEYYREWDFGEGVSVSPEFYDWFTANASQVIPDLDYLIKHSTLASIADSIRTKTGKTDLIIPVDMPDEILSISSIDTSDATANAEHVLKGYTAYGRDGKIEGGIETYDGESSDITGVVGGECNGTHVIEVDELPTENIDEEALYKVGDTYHRYGGELLDVLMVEYDGLMVNSLVDGIKTTGITVELLYVKTKPTENIKETDDSIYNVYYVEDEDNIFVHTNGMWLTVSTALDGMFAYFKTVRSIDDIGDTGEYGGVLCALIYTGWKDYPWANGTLTIEEIGIHNVTDKKEVNVNLGAVVGVWKFKQGGVCTNDDLSDWEKFQPVNFTTTINGEVVDCIGIERYDDQKSGGCTMRYKLNDGSYYDAWCLLGIPEWKDEGCKTVDFGTEPQIVSGEFKTEFSKVATPISTGGECSGTHIIEVDELPTENIDENAVYLCGGKYYKWAYELADVLAYQEGMGDPMPLWQAVNGDPSLFTYYYVPTKPTENIAVSGDDVGINIYYVEDENNLFVYGAFDETGENAWFTFADMTEAPFIGIVENSSEVTEDGLYALSNIGWQAYIHATKQLDITENGTYDVVENASVNVDVPNEAINGVWKFNVYDSGGTLYIDLPYLKENGEGNLFTEINFTCEVNGEVRSFYKFEYYSESYRHGGTDIHFIVAAGNSVHAAYGFGKTSYWSGFDGTTVSPIIDFGAEPQIVSKAFKDLMNQIATKQPESSGGAELNIAYGDTEPTDTSKLWVKADKPNSVKISADFEGTESLQSGISALSTAVSSIAVAAVDSKIYQFGGNVQSTRSKAISVYDVETGKNTTLSVTLPEYLTGSAAAAVGTKIYLFGGVSASSSYTSTTTYSNAIRVFDTETNTLSTLSTTLKMKTAHGSAVAIGTKIYLVGFHGGNTNYIENIQVFDTETNTIAEGAVFGNYSDLATAVVGNKIYFFGGGSVEQSGYAATASKAIKVFDIQTSELSQVATLPKALYSIAAAAVGTKIYLFGGEPYTGTPADTIIEFDTKTNAVRTLPVTLPQTLCDIGVATVANKIYLFGGFTDEYNKTASNGIHSFTVTTDLPVGELLITPSLNDNVFSLINSEGVRMESGVDGVYIGNLEGYAETADAYLYRGIEKVVVHDNLHYLSSATQVSSGTSLTASVNCAVGSLVVAAIATRDTLTISDGCTLVSTSEINSTDTDNQRLSWAWKFAESATESITVTQANAQRLYVALVALQGATGIIDNGYFYRDDTTSNAITVNKPDGLVLWGLSAPSWGGNSAPYNVWAASNDIPVVQAGETAQSRLGIGIDQTEEASVTFTGGVTASQMTVGCLTVQGMDKFYTDNSYNVRVWENVNNSEKLKIKVEE